MFSIRPQSSLTMDDGGPSLINKFNIIGPETGPASNYWTQSGDDSYNESNDVSGLNVMANFPIFRYFAILEWLVLWEYLFYIFKS